MITPFPFAAATWLVLFVLRPVELYFAPDHAALALSELGFTLGDLTRTTALAGLGCATWCAGYLVALGPTRATLPAARPLSVSGRGAAVALAFGTLCWGLLFQRQGGLSALVHSPASIRINEGASFYGFVGVWIVEGVTLAGLAAMLQKPDRTARRIFFAGAALSIAASLCLQLRSLAALGVLAAVAVVLALRVPSRRTVVVASVGLVLAVLALGITQQLRAYTATVSTREAITLTAKTPPWAMYVSDLSTFDNFVAMQGLVPDSITYLDGQTIAEIPLAFLPRALWPDKPLGIDFRTSSYLYPGIFVGVPISLQGELYWNAGVPLVAVGALVLGLALGLVARLGLGVRSVAVGFLVYAITLAFVHGLVTRGLAVSLENLAFAVVGVALGGWAVLPGEARSFYARTVAVLTRRRSRPSARFES